MPVGDYKPLDRRFGRWPAGVDQVSDVRSLQAREVPAVRAGLNVDFTNDGRPRRRSGYTPVRDGSRAHSLWAPVDGRCGYFVQDGVFNRLRFESNGAELIEPLATVGTLRKPMAYAEIAGRIFVSSPKTRFVIGPDGTLASWGVDQPAGNPQCAVIADGDLPEGQYQVAVTFQTADGEESGTGAASAAVIAKGAFGGLQLLNIPQPAATNVARINLYLTQANDAILRRAGSVRVGVTTAVLNVPATDGKVLDTQHCTRVPFMRLMAAYRGRLYFVPAHGDGTRLFYTEPMRYGLFRPHQNYLSLPNPITAMVALSGGLYVGTEGETFYFAGEEPKAMTRTRVANVGIVPGTAAVMRGQIFGPDAANDDVAVWWNTAGELVRASGGASIVNLTRGRVALPRYAEGTILAREFDGLSQIVSSLRGPQESSSLKAQDRATAKLYRNGVAI